MDGEEYVRIQQPEVRKEEEEGEEEEGEEEEEDTSPYQSHKKIKIQN